MKFGFQHSFTPRLYEKCHHHVSKKVKASNAKKGIQRFMPTPR